MIRLALTTALFVAALCAVAGATDQPCRTEYVVPYAEQCNFAYRELHKKTSPQDLTLAFNTCYRAQTEALPCLKSGTAQTHVVALSALYRSVSAQADIAMFAQQYRVAEALLREKLNVLDIVSREAQPGDGTPARERKATQSDIADALAGQCTQKASAVAGQQFLLGKAHRYGDLATLLKHKSDDYTACAKATTTSARKAYVEYQGLVALEESGRASQAAGNKDDANRSYQDCIDGANRSSQYAAGHVKNFLATVGALCQGRKSGNYRVDQPEPIDADDGKTFRPLTLPKG